MATLIDYEPNVGGAASVLQAAARVIQQAEIERLARLAENPPMTKTLAERQADFRQAMKEAGYVRLQAWVTKEQRDKFRQIGGDEWLRKKIDAAKYKGISQRT